jgi:predicted DNA-binding transcriptional regulator AlpA
MSEDQGLVTAEEAIARLGISRATFYNYARSLDRFRRVGDRRVLYRAIDIDAMAAPHPIRSIEGETEGPAVNYKTIRRRKPGRPKKQPS